MSNNNLLAGLDNLDFTGAVQNLIKKSCIIDYGIIRKVIAKGVVDVELSVAATSQDIVCMTCVLANIASSAFTLDVEPSEGDKVIVFYPRKYAENMFNVEQSKVIVNPNTNGYNLTAGIAFLFNQYKKDKHKNVVHLNADGTSSVVINDSDGNTLLDLSVKTSGISVKDKNGCTIVSSSDAVVINGKLKIKNSSSQGGENE